MGGFWLLQATTVTVLLLAVSTAVVHSCPPSDRAALLAFKEALHEPKFGIFNSWTGADCCHKWYGVSCDRETGRVADINLRGEAEEPIFERAHRTGYMTGYISPAICKLARLSSITVADWKGISGEIPRCITSLPFLRIIDLIGNRISGTIPYDIGRLHRLTVLNVADNAISGRIPPSLASNAEPGLAEREFVKRADPGLNFPYLPSRGSGSISQPGFRAHTESLGKMAVLSTLNLDMNKLTGPIPMSLFSSGISDLNLSRNSLEGNIPDMFGVRSYFTVLDLSYNNLKGAIPKSMSSASFIGHLDLSHNHLCGPIPVGSPFDHLEASSFVYNDCLCGKPLKAC
ncbi:Leucine-rich repeat [Sesbania bispinosa]|nr:Leucine-rich repeat [Sesbania bispinosa]